MGDFYKRAFRLVGTGVSVILIITSCKCCSSLEIEDISGVSLQIVVTCSS